ncbi:hypothetical protein EIN_519410, partial [Entamoeba invadens IP1]
MLFLCVLLFISAYSQNTYLYVAQDVDCHQYPRNRKYKMDTCIKTGTGSTIWTTNDWTYFQNKSYTTPDCSGEPLEYYAPSSSDWFNVDLKNNPLAFVSDKNKGCEDGETIDGVYYNDECFLISGWYKYFIVKENGKSYLKKGFMMNDCNGSPREYTESYICNKCTYGVLVKCYNVDGDIDRTEAYAEGEIPSPGFEPNPDK